METSLVIGLLALLGLLFGSFAGAQVWRLRARQLRDEDTRLIELNRQKELSEDEKEEKSYLEKEAKDRRDERLQLDGLLGGVTEDYSRCLTCSHKLAWYDLLPLISWLSTGGKCRYCQAKIGRFEPLMEIGVAVVFAVSYLLWPVPLASAFDIALFLLWLISTVLLAILFAYDAKWYLLPDVITFPLIGVAAVMAALKVLHSENAFLYCLSIVGAIIILSGLYLLLWFMSRGRWVGFGDVKLGLGLALLLADWRLALLTLFLANLIGTLIVIPGMVIGKVNRKAHVPFGPLLIAGMLIAMVIGDKVISIYLGAVF